MKYDIISIGEALIDFTDIGMSKNGMKIFEQNPGGAPANVACACAKLGLSTAFIGKVGNDMHGEFLIETLNDCGVDTNYMIKDNDHFTTLAFVKLDKNGDRTFSFSRKKSADTMLSDQDIDFDAIKNTTVLHFGSLSFTDEPSKSTTLECIKTARDNGVIISYDPNYRPLLWKNVETAVLEMCSVLDLVDIIKISDNELKLICNTENPYEAAEFLHSKGIKIVLITLGKDGALVSYNNKTKLIPAADVEVVDTTGAGDSFLGGFLYKLIKNNSGCDVDFEKALEFAEFASKVSGHCITKRGAIPSLPHLKDIL